MQRQSLIIKKPQELSENYISTAEETNVKTNKMVKYKIIEKQKLKILKLKQLNAAESDLNEQEAPIN